MFGGIRAGRAVEAWQMAPDLRVSQMLSQYLRNVEIYELIRMLHQFIHKFEI
jgi:hypothetical protein